MITVAEYRIENERLMNEYEEKVRGWLSQEKGSDVADILPFYRDGVTNPEEWFKESNTFRPLFVLKEVSVGSDTIDGLKKYLDIFGNPKHFDFVEYPFDDVKIGTFSQWKRIAKLAAGLKEIHDGKEYSDYYSHNFDFVDGGDEYIYTGDIEGYKDKKSYYKRTANKDYNDIINRIAIFEIKKVGGGTGCNSKLSMAGEHYTDHIEPFLDLIIKQIVLIDPTVIICLGRENGACTRALLSEIEKEVGDRIWLEGYHHQFSSNKKFYYDRLEDYRKVLLENRA